MARPHKQMPGKTYYFIQRGDLSFTVYCSYLCPYCHRDTTARFDANEDAADTLEQGGFFEPLRCDLCGKVTDVRFYHANRI